MKTRVLAAVLSLMLLSGCVSQNGGLTENRQNELSSSSEVSGSSEKVNFDEAPYEINYLYLVAQEGSNQSKVAQAVNDLAMKELNMTVKLIPMTFGTYNSQISMMLAANEPLDIFLAASNQFSTYIDSQYRSGRAKGHF